MKKFFCSTLSILFCAQLVANQPPMATPEKDLESRIQMGGDYAYVRIKPHGETRTHGNLGGAQAIYEYRAANRIYGAAALTWREGKTTGSGVDKTLVDVDAQERIGYTFVRDDKTARLSIYTGFGYRYLGEKVTTTGTPIRFNYNEFYVPVGFLLEGKINSTFSMGLNAQWMPQVYSSVVIKPMGGARWILTNQLSNYLLEAPLTITLSHKYRVHLIISPFIATWHDGHTSAVTETGTALNVPKNDYFFAGANVNFCFSF